MNTCVVMPTYNEADAIGGLVKQIRAQGLEPLVIDDGSRDNTVDIARYNGASILVNQDNEGKGSSLVKGFNYALDKGFDAVITMDGDGQHLPSDIPYFLGLAEKSSNQMFIGNRMSKPNNMPWVRLLTNKFMSWLISFITKQDIPDTQCGFRLIKRQALENLKLKTRNYEIESEMLIKASQLGLKIESVPINTVYKGEKSQINPFIDTFRFIKFIIKELWTTKH